MLKEINIEGVFIAPFAGYLAIALLVFMPLRRIFDHYIIERWVWHRPFFDFSVFVILVSILGLMF